MVEIKLVMGVIIVNNPYMKTASEYIYSVTAVVSVHSLRSPLLLRACWYTQDM